MKKLLLLLIIPLFFSCNSCKNDGIFIKGSVPENATGEVYKILYDGMDEKRLRMGRIVRGEEEGEWTDFYDNGKIKSVSNYKKGVCFYIEKYCENGQVFAREHWKEDWQKTGTDNYYWCNGNFHYSQNNDIDVGQRTIIKSYDKNGLPLLHYELKKYYSDYAKKESFCKDGFYNSYRGNGIISTGKLYDEGFYECGKKTGKWTVYDKNENISSIEYYEKDLLIKREFVNGAVPDIDFGFSRTK